MKTIFLSATLTFALPLLVSAQVTLPAGGSIKVTSSLVGQTINCQDSGSEFGQPKFFKASMQVADSRPTYETQKSCEAGQSQIAVRAEQAALNKAHSDCVAAGKRGCHQYGYTEFRYDNNLASADNHCIATVTVSGN